MPQLDTSLKEPRATVLIPGARVRYLAEIAEQGRGINTDIDLQAEIAARAQNYYQSLKDLGDPQLPKPLDRYDPSSLHRAKSIGAEAPPTVTPSGVAKREGGRTAHAASSSRNQGTTSANEPMSSGVTVGGASAPIADFTEDRTLLTLRQRYNDALTDLSND